jgi:hypothetical protein
METPMSNVSSSFLPAGTTLPGFPNTLSLWSEGLSGPSLSVGMDLGSGTIQAGSGLYLSSSTMQAGSGLYLSSGTIQAGSGLYLSGRPFQTPQGTYVGGGINQTPSGIYAIGSINQASPGLFTGNSPLTPTGTLSLPWDVLQAPAGESPQPMFVAEVTVGEQIFDAVQALYLSQNRPRDRQIAGRLTALYRDALEEEETIRPGSIAQFKQFFLNNKDVGFPRITLTPDGTLRVRWIQGEENFVAIEFTRKPEAKLVAEIPGLVPPMHFGTEPLDNIVAVARDLGGSLE